MEKRSNSLEIRQKEGLISGYAILWDQFSDIGGFREKFIRDSIKEDITGTSLYFQHDKNNLLANSKSGTMKVFSDDKGLGFEATLPKSQREKYSELINRGDVQGVSIGFIPKKDNWIGQDRTISEATLFEISLVDKPAHKTELAIRDKKPAHRKDFRWNKLIIGV